MEIKQRIDQFNQENPPFYIVAHDDGEFSLCLPLDLLSDEYRLYGQDAFDAYATEIGEPVCDEIWAEIYRLTAKRASSFAMQTACL